MNAPTTPSARNGCSAIRPPGGDGEPPGAQPTPWRHSAARTLTTAIVAFNVTFGAAWPVLALYEQLRLGLVDIGFGILVTGAISGIVGSSAYGWIERHFRLGDVMRVGLLVETGAHLTLAVMTSSAVDSRYCSCSESTRQCGEPSQTAFATVRFLRQCNVESAPSTSRASKAAWSSEQQSVASSRPGPGSRPFLVRIRRIRRHPHRHLAPPRPDRTRDSRPTKLTRTVNTRQPGCRPTPAPRLRDLSARCGAGPKPYWERVAPDLVSIG